MDDRREAQRKIAGEVIEVYDINSKRYLGRVVNLTADGMMLISPTAIMSNLIFQLVLVPEVNSPSQGTLQLGAESLWCFAANQPHHYWTGFRIVDIPLGTIEHFEPLVELWRIDGDID